MLTARNINVFRNQIALAFQSLGITRDWVNEEDAVDHDMLIVESATLEQGMQSYSATGMVGYLLTANYEALPASHIEQIVFRAPVLLDLLSKVDVAPVGAAGWNRFAAWACCQRGMAPAAKLLCLTLRETAEKPSKQDRWAQSGVSSAWLPTAPASPDVEDGGQGDHDDRLLVHPNASWESRALWSVFSEMPSAHGIDVQELTRIAPQPGTAFSDLDRRVFGVLAGVADHSGFAPRRALHLPVDAFLFRIFTHVCGVSAELRRQHKQQQEVPLKTLDATPNDQSFLDVLLAYASNRLAGRNLVDVFSDQAVTDLVSDWDGATQGWADDVIQDLSTSLNYTRTVLQNRETQLDNIKQQTERMKDRQNETRELYVKSKTSWDRAEEKLRKSVRQRNELRAKLDDRAQSIEQLRSSGWFLLGDLLGLVGGAQGAPRRPVRWWNLLLLPLYFRRYKTLRLKGMHRSKRIKNKQVRSRSS